MRAAMSGGKVSLYFLFVYSQFYGLRLFLDITSNVTRFVCNSIHLVYASNTSFPCLSLPLPPSTLFPFSLYSLFYSLFSLLLLSCLSFQHFNALLILIYYSNYHRANVRSGARARFVRSSKMQFFLTKSNTTE